MCLLPSSRPLLSSLSAISSSRPRVVDGEYFVTESIRPLSAFSSRSKRLSMYLSILSVANMSKYVLCLVQMSKRTTAPFPSIKLLSRWVAF